MVRSFSRLGGNVQRYMRDWAKPQGQIGGAAPECGDPVSLTHEEILLRDLVAARVDESCGGRQFPRLVHPAFIPLQDKVMSARSAAICDVHDQLVTTQIISGAQNGGGLCRGSNAREQHGT